MNRLNEINAKLSYLEEKSKKYNMLTNLTDEQIKLLKEIITSFKNKRGFDKKNIKISEKNKILKNKLVEKNIDFENITSKKTLEDISNLIKKEIKKLLEIEKKLNNLINYKNILNYDFIKKSILKDNILTSDEEYETITTLHNKEQITKLIDYKNKINIINRKTLEKHIKKELKKIITEIDNEINSICYNIKIDYKNKTYKEKYYEIMEKIKETINNYKEVQEDINLISNSYNDLESILSRQMKKSGCELSLNYDEIKELANLDISKLIKEIILYNEAKKHFTDKSKKLF